MTHRSNRKLAASKAGADDGVVVDHEQTRGATPAGSVADFAASHRPGWRAA